MITASLLAGCIAGEDSDPAQETQEQEGPDDGYGTIEGTIVTVDLNPVEGARVHVVSDAELVAETTTSPDGTYTINNVEPGEYRLQVTAPCCREFAQGILVQEDEVLDVSVQLEVFTKDDLQEGYVEQFEWTGFIACSVRARSGVPQQPYSGVSVCSIYDPTGDDDFLHTWEIREGVKTVVGGMTWRNPSVGLGDELSLIFEVAGRPNSPPNYAYADGTSPLEIRADAGAVIEEYDEEIHEYDFENVDGSLELMYRVFAGGQVTVVYQQQFTVFWDVYYWEQAPEGASALPDE